MNSNAPEAADAGDPTRPNAAHLRPGLPESGEDLLRTVRNQNSALQVEDAFPMPTWFIQQKAWIENPAKSDSSIYNIPVFLRIRGPLNDGALQQSLQEIVRRHGALRSVFRIIEGRLVQVVLASQQFSLTSVDAGGSAEARETRMREAARAEALRPFDFARGPMLRGQLIRLETDHHVLQLTSHHLTFDDWSSGVLIHQLSELYRNFVAGTAPTISALAFQYGDFVRWQSKQLQGPELDSELRFGRQQLAFGAAFEHLPADFPPPAHNTHTGARATAVLPTAQADALKAVCRQERVSIFMALLAGFACLLHRYSGDEEIGVGSCAANRPLLEVEGLIGRFGNSMFLRTSLSGNPTFSELLKRVREVSLKASTHLELPFGMLMEAIAEESGRNQNPIQVMFILQNAPKDGLELAGLSVEWAPVDVGTAKYDLNVWLKIEPAVEITFEYNTQVFSPASIGRFLADYQSILQTIAKNPAERVGNIRISPKPEVAGDKPARGFFKSILNR